MPLECKLKKEKLDKLRVFENYLNPSSSNNKVIDDNFRSKTLSTHSPVRAISQKFSFVHQICPMVFFLVKHRRCGLERLQSEFIMSDLLHSILPISYSSRWLSQPKFNRQAYNYIILHSIYSLPRLVNLNLCHLWVLK